MARWAYETCLGFILTAIIMSLMRKQIYVFQLSNPKVLLGNSTTELKASTQRTGPPVRHVDLPASQ